MMTKFKNLTLNITDQEYRDLPYYNYSKIAKYARDGVKSLTTDEKIDNASIMFGSLVDCLITDRNSFHDKYAVVHFNISDTIRPMIDWLVGNDSLKPLDPLDSLPTLVLKEVIDKFNFGGSNWKDETKIAKLIEGGKDYYTACIRNKNKTVISQNLFEEAMFLCNEIVNGIWTKKIFNKRDDDDYEFLYQSKFVAPYSSQTIIPLFPGSCLNSFSTTIKGMIDILIIDHFRKRINIYDVKTTSSTLKEFEESFFKWKYNIQNDVYKYIIEKVVAEDNYFEKYFVCDPIFIVASRYEKKVQMFDYQRSYLKENMNKKWYNLLRQMYWHDHTKNYDYEHDVYKNNGKITIYE